jgi:hypothetical protein
MLRDQKSLGRLLAPTLINPCLSILERDFKSASDGVTGQRHATTLPLSVIRTSLPDFTLLRYSLSFAFTSDTAAVSILNLLYDDHNSHISEKLQIVFLRLGKTQDVRPALKWKYLQEENERLLE